VHIRVGFLRMAVAGNFHIMLQGWCKGRRGEKVKVVVAATAYDRRSEGGEGGCWKRRNLMRFERNPLTALGLCLTLGRSRQMGPLLICASRRPPGL